MLAAVCSQGFDAGQHQLGDLQACTAFEVIGLRGLAVTN